MAAFTPNVEGFGERADNRVADILWTSLATVALSIGPT